MELHARLVAARIAAGYKTAAGAAEALGVNYQTYAGHENGNSGFRSATGAKYARKFKVRFDWLMTGAGTMTDKSSAYGELIDIYDALPPELKTAYLDVLRKLAAPYQKPREPKPEIAAKTPPEK